MSEKRPMRVAIFNHPYTDFYSSDSRVSPAAVAHLKKIMTAFLPPGNILCCSVTSPKKHPQSLPESLQYLSPYLLGDQSQYSFFTQYSQFGLASNFDHKKLKRFRPNCFFITSFAYCYFDGFSTQAAYLKKLYPHAPIVCGGAGPSCFPEYYLNNSCVDVVVKGPAELVLPRLLAQLESGVSSVDLPNVYCRSSSDDAIVLTSVAATESTTFSSTVAAPWAMVPFMGYQKKRNRVQLQVTRGCPKKCAYCSIHSNSFGMWTKVPVADVIAELAQMTLPENVHFDFEDDNITYDRSYCLTLLDAIKTAYPQATFSAENGVDFTTLDDLFIDELQRYGFTGLNISLTSVSVSTLLRQGRLDYIDRFEKVVEKLARIGVPTTVYYICGLPKDSIENNLNTLQFLMNKPVLIGISPFYAVPGTRLWRFASSIAPIHSRGTSFYRAGELTTGEIVTFFMFTRAINFLKSTNNALWQRDKDHLKAMNGRNERLQLSRKAWRRSFGNRRLTGYRFENDACVDTPYPLEVELEKKLFSLIEGDTPIQTCDGEELDKRLWL